MSNENEIDPLDMFKDLREDAPVAAKPFVKPAVKVDAPAVSTEVPLIAAQMIAVAKIVEEQTRKAIASSKFNPNMPGQVLPKAAVNITDFSKLTMDDVYDLSVPIEAKAFMDADVLAIKLRDSNYEARWVNKNPQNLGDKIGKGFTYIEPNDLVSADAIQTSLDADGHYCFNDVVAMKIDKATYYRALRAAHERAVRTTDQASSRTRAASMANQYMTQESGVGSDFRDASAMKKMTFYDPGVEV